MKAEKAEKIINFATILLVCALGIVSFYIMNLTAQSNSVTVDAVVHHSKKESLVVKEIRLLTLEIRNLEKQVKSLREEIEKE